jgi:hypothetical protein
MSFPDFGYLTAQTSLYIPGQNKQWGALDIENGKLFLDGKQIVTSVGDIAAPQQQPLTLSYFPGDQTDISSTYQSNDNYVRILPELNGLEMTGDVLLRNVVSKSDRSLKEDIEDFNSDDALALIRQLQCVTFAWKKSETKKREIGLIAQDVQKIVPEIVDLESKGIQYSGLTALLCSALKSMTERVEVLEKKILILEAKK